MGWERKRGKLHELNRLLRGATDTSFVPTGSVAPSGVRYVITLDADTRLPRGAVERLVGTMAHPLNQPRFDPGQHRVVEGYAVLQPRVTPPLPGREGSWFQRLSSGPAGIDPYAAAVSDVYQDLWGEGSYTGKGIYDVDAFEAALAGRVPENALLSHDLFEGVFARAGLVTDVELFESAPSHYGVAAARQHRWARGDWQLLPWILGRRRPGDRALEDAGQPPPHGVGAGDLPDARRRVAGAWGVARDVERLRPRHDRRARAPAGAGRRDPSPARHLQAQPCRAVGRDLVLAASQVGLTLTMLAYQAWLMTDAIVRTLVRVYGTRRRLLEWVTAAQAKAGLRLDLCGLLPPDGRQPRARRRRAPSRWRGRGRRPGRPRCPFSSLWAAAPAVARWISLPRTIATTEPLTLADAGALRLIARRTWRYFATFVTPEDHALPPDNFQETPSPVVAHRTSPTNIGLYLLATVAARDFGWLGTIDTVERLERTLETMRRLERFRGHFYNWYETRRCEPLEPKYVSSVDSGNLAGHLIALAHAVEDMVAHPYRARAALAGIGDTVQLVRLAMVDATAPRSRAALEERMEEALAAVTAIVPAPSLDPAEWPARLAELRARVQTVLDVCAGAGRRGSRPRADGGARVGGGARRDRREPHARHRLDRRARSPPRRRCAGRPGAGRRHGLRLPLRPDAQAVRDRLPRRRRHPGPQPLRPARVGSAAGQLRGDRQGRRAGLALVPPGPRAHAGGARLGARVLVGVDVRVPDAASGHAGAGRQPAGADRAARRGTADHVWRRARRAVGRVGVGLQRAGSRDDLPVLELRRPGPRAAARAQRGRGHRALCDGTGGDDRSVGRRPQFPAPGGGRGQRRLRLLRGARLHRVPAARRRRARAGARLHGAPPGHADRGDRERPARRLDARALPRRADGPGHRAAPARADAARRGGRPAARGRGAGRRRRARVRAAGRAALHLTARRHAADAAALERTLRGDADDGGLGLQPLARPRHHAMAGGRHARRVGDLRVPSRRRQRRDLVGRLPAAGRHAGQLRGHVFRGPGRDRPAGPDHRHDAPGDRVAGGRRRDPARVAHELRDADAGDRADVVRRDRAGAAGGGPGPPGVLQLERADRVRARSRHAAGHPPAAVGRRGPGLAGPRGRRSRASGRSPAVGDRSQPVPRPRPRDPDTGGGDRGPAAVRHHRRGARSDREPAAAGAGPGW